MGRPAPERLRPEAYAQLRPLEPRFGDMDALRHLNNVAIARFYEDGRVRFTEGLGLRAALEPAQELVVVEVAIQYLGEGAYPDPLTLGSAIGRIGSSSFSVVQALFQHGRCIGAAETVLVGVDRGAGKARPLGPEAVACLEAGRFRAASG